MHQIRDKFSKWKQQKILVGKNRCFSGHQKENICVFKIYSSKRLFMSVCKLEIYKF